jgi:fluoroquinolone transport system permease protein
MSRLAATLRADVRVQLRNGFYHATAFVVVTSILLLRWMPADATRFLLPVVILGNVLMNTFYFVSGLLLLEREEGTFAAQSVTPLRDHEYLAAKLVTLGALSLAEGLLLALAVLGFEARLLGIAVGIALASVLFCLAGVALVVRYGSINEFLLPSVLYTGLLTLPLLGAFGLGSPEWYLPHPLQGPLSLMGIGGGQTAGRLAYAIGYPLLWVVPAAAWSRRALGRARAA